MDALPVDVVRDGLGLLLTLSGPLLSTLLGVGLFMGAVQTATQINDPALGFVPRFIALITTLAVLGAWVMESFAGFFTSSVQGIAG